MSTEETKELLKKMKEYSKDVSSDSKKAKAFLQKVGILDKKGNLSKFYRTEKVA